MSHYLSGIVNNLACLYEKMGEYAKAEPLYQEALRVRQKVCDTGSGEARAGEGVMGLRRGFFEAGAQNLLMTLWPISDEFTGQIMADFYDAAHQSGNAPEALAD